jgi:hypothetical protein
LIGSIDEMGTPEKTLPSDQLPFARHQTLRAVMCLVAQVAHQRHAPDEDALHDPRAAIVPPEELPELGLAIANPYQVLVLGDALGQLHDFLYRILALLGEKIEPTIDVTKPQSGALASVLSELADIGAWTRILQAQCHAITHDLDTPDWVTLLEKKYE